MDVGVIKCIDVAVLGVRYGFYRGCIFMSVGLMILKWGLDSVFRFDFDLKNVCF